MAGDRSKAEMDREIDRALARGRRRAVTEPQAERAHYERADFTVPGLLMGVFGTRAWMMSELARRAGEAKQALQTKQTN